jgi:hypothetical protein
VPDKIINCVTRNLPLCCEFVLGIWVPGWHILHIYYILHTAIRDYTALKKFQLFLLGTVLNYNIIIQLYAPLLQKKVYWAHKIFYMNNDQHAALFVFSLLSYLTSIGFRRKSSSSWGGRMYIQYVANGACCTVQLTVSRPGLPADSQLYSITSTICHIYTFYLLMMSCWYARNM